MFGKKLKNDVPQEVVCDTKTVEVGYGGSRYTTMNISLKVPISIGIKNMIIVWASSEEAIKYLADKKQMIRHETRSHSTFVLIDELLMDMGFFKGVFKQAALNMSESAITDVIEAYRYDIKNMLHKSLMGYPMTFGYDKDKKIWNRLGLIDNQAGVGELRTYRVVKDIHSQILLDKLNNKQTT